VIELNEAAESMLGMNLTSCTADLTWWRLLSVRRTSDGSALDIARGALDTGRAVRDVVLELERSGSTFALSANYVPLCSEAGTVEALVVSLRDVTARERERRDLVATHERLREAHDVARLASWEWQPDTGDVLVFQALAESDMETGTVVTLEEWLAMVPVGEHSEIHADFAAFVAGERDESVRRFRHVLASGPIWLEIRSRAVREPDGDLICVRGTAQDVSEQELANQQLKDASDFFQGTLDSLSAQVAVLDELGIVVMTNRAWREFAAADSSAPGLAGVGANYLAACENAGNAQATRMAAQLRAVATGVEPELLMECSFEGPSLRRWFQMRATRYEGAGALRVVVSYEDVSERKESERALLRGNDHLLAVTNSMGEGVLTLDGSGRVTYLNQAAEGLLGWSLREVAGRAIHPLIHGLKADGSPLPAKACQILRALRACEAVRVTDDLFIRADGSLLPVSFTAAPLVSEADGNGCVVVFEDVTQRKAKERLVEEDLDKLAWVARVEEALTEDRFVLHAQPILDLATGQIVQRELLIRMSQPDGASTPGLIPPGSFLPVAEEFGQIAEIDRWVIDRAAEVAAASLPIELNVSGRSIADPRLIGHIERALERTGADPRTMVFEITETALVSNEDAGRAFVEGLHRLGCKVALDDFGTGYGGFTYVKRLPIDFLKIDIEFVRDLRENPASRSVIQAIVKLAQGFGLKTVAEGVEDQETLELLRDLAVDYAQGYHIGSPAPLASAIRSLDLPFRGSPGVPPEEVTR